MDHLDQLVGLAEPLLSRVDDALTRAGAPPGHPVWPALREVGLLPAAAVRAVAALGPATLDVVGHSLRDLRRGAEDVAGALPRPDAWSGEAAEAYAVARERLAADLAAHPGGLAARLDHDAAFADAVATWMRDSRHLIAATLAEVLSSAEAVALLTADPAERAAPAADVAVRVLRSVALAYEAAGDLPTS